MNPARLIGAGVLLFFLGAAAPMHAQQDQQEKDAKVSKHEQPAKPEKQQQQPSQPAKQHQATGQAQERQQQQQANVQQNQQGLEHQQQENRSVQQRSPANVREQQEVWQRERARNWQSEHRTWQERGGYNGYRIPDDRFQSNYGQNHAFRIYSLPVIFVGRQQRFQFGGYWFGLVDPWPEYWSNDWYDNDDMWVGYYDGGYYLCNRRYPSDRIAITFYYVGG